MDNKHTGNNSVWQQLANQLSPRHNKLAIILGNEAAEAMADEGCVSLNLNVQLAQALLNIPVAKRPRKVKDILGGMLTDLASPYVCLIGLEVLFEPSLQIQIVDLLKQLAHDHVIVVAWPGDYVKAEKGGKLSYSELGHIENQAYTITTKDDFDVIPYQYLIKDTA